MRSSDGLRSMRTALDYVFVIGTFPTCWYIDTVTTGLLSYSKLAFKKTLSWLGKREEVPAGRRREESLKLMRESDCSILGLTVLSALVLCSGVRGHLLS